MDNLYKTRDVLKYKNQAMAADEQLSPSLLNFILFFTINSIDSRLMDKIKDKWGHLMDSEVCLFDLKDKILKAIPELLKKLDQKEFEANALSNLTLSGFSGRGRGQSRGQAKGGQAQFARAGRLFCRLCQAAKEPRRVFTSHNIKDCRSWSRKDVEDLRIMMCELETDPDQYPESRSDED